MPRHACHLTLVALAGAAIMLQSAPRIAAEPQTLLKPENIAIAIDGKVLAEEMVGTIGGVVLESIEPGPHTLTVTAKGTQTRYPLSQNHADEPLETPVEPRVDVEFVVGR